MMIDIKIWDRVERLMDHLEERRAEDKYVKSQIKERESLDTQICFNQPTTDIHIYGQIFRFHSRYQNIMSLTAMTI